MAATSRKSKVHGYPDLEKASRGNKPTKKRLIAFVWKDCPPASLAKAQRSTDWIERAAIARNPQTPASTLQNLAEDVHPVVRALARGNLDRRSA